MTSQTKNPYPGLPKPVTKLTMEQDLKLRTIEDGVRANWDTEKEAIITYFRALQHQNFLLGNSVQNLVSKWPPPPPAQTTTNEALSMFGILLETKD